MQYVNRPDANFRGYAGTIASGEIAVGDSVLAVPSRKQQGARDRHRRWHAGEGRRRRRP